MLFIFFYNSKLHTSNASKIHRPRKFKFIAVLFLCAENFLLKHFSRCSKFANHFCLILLHPVLTSSEKTISSFNHTHMKRQFVLCFSLLFFYFFSQAQTITVTGTVRDQN